MESIIKWQTGLPELSGLYLVTLSTGEVTVMEWYNPYTSSPYWLDEDKEEGEVVAWCDFKDVEPYKEKTNDYTTLVTKERVLRYLREELYPYPSCGHCQYSDIGMKRVPCNRCSKDGDKYKLHKGHEADLRRMTREIVRIAKQDK